MRRSICYCEPSFASAGQVATWQFIYTTASNLKKGARLKFDLLSKGRDIDWEIPEVDLKKGSENCIYAFTEGSDKLLKAKEVDTPDSFVPQYEFTLTEDIKAGETFTVALGVPKGQSSAGNEGSRCQTITQRRRSFLLYLDPKGKGNYEDPEIFAMDIRGNVLEKINILAPSIVAKNKRFDVVIRFEDEFDNLTCNAPEDTLVELSYENIRENLNWKLFVPETGFITIPNFYFNEPGVFKILLTVVNTGVKYYSSPIKCFHETDQNVFWGILHGESERVDSSENIESCLRHFRDDKALNFFSSSSFESAEETPNDVWKLVSQNIADFNEDERFTSFLGFQWHGDNKGEGLRHLVYTKDNKPLLRKKDSKYNSLNKIYKSFTPSDMISIPSFSMGNGMGCNFDNFNPDFERVVEIYNAWGSSECSEKEGNSRPITCDKKGVKESPEGSVQRALQQGLRFGFVAGGLDDRGGFMDFFDSDQEQYSPGLTAIISVEHTRDGLLDSLYKRSCYATTGKKIIMEFSLAGNPMGSEISTSDKPGLIVNRHLCGFVAGTGEIQSVEVIRNGTVIKTLVPEEYHFEFTYDDMEKLQNVVLQPKDKKQVPFVYYYLRVKQADGHIAWSSPIWVDLGIGAVAAKRKKAEALKSS
ncbi:MAG: hypothetical protein ACI9S8_001343 [Chlamydiales bacterium]|jgi:hypothetical protein